MTDIDTLVERAVHEAVVKDRYDRKDYDDTLGWLDDLSAAKAQLEGITPHADDVMADAHAMFLRPTIRMHDEVDPVYELPSRVLHELPDTDSFRTLKAQTTGDPLLSGMAVTSLAKHLGPMFDRLQEVQEKADRAQELRDRLQELLAQQGDDEAGEGDPSLDEAIDTVTGEVAAAEAELDTALTDAEARIGMAARAGIEEAGETVGDAATAIAGWGQEASQFAARDPEARLKLMRKMQTDDMRRIAELFGRMRWSMMADVQKSFINGPTEIHSVTTSNDLAHLLPSQLVLLDDPDLEIEFFRRFVNRELLCYRLIEREKMARGPVVLVLDASGSMQGARFEWVVAFALCLLSIARMQGRAFYALFFHSVDKVEQFSFPKPAEFRLDEMLAMASVVSSGGTDFMGPLTSAADLCMADHQETNLKGADIIFASDGIASVTDAWLNTFRAQRDHAGFRTWGIAVERAVPQIINDICELTATVGDLSSGGDVSKIFTHVAQNYQPVRRG